MVGQLYPMSFLVAINPLNTASQFAYSPVKGKIRQITISWPDGSNFLVEALFRKGKIQIFPAQTLGTGLPTGVALNNFTLPTPMNYPVGENDALELYVINHDGTNTHHISAVLLIEESEDEHKEQVINEERDEAT